MFKEDKQVKPKPLFEDLSDDGSNDTSCSDGSCTVPNKDEN